MNQTDHLTDQEMLEDLLSAQKMITGSYNSFACECAGDGLKNEMVALLGEEHQIQHELFAEMEKRGWYQPEPAEHQKISRARERFRGVSN